MYNHKKNMIFAVIAAITEYKIIKGEDKLWKKSLKEF